MNLVGTDGYRKLTQLDFSLIGNIDKTAVENKSLQAFMFADDPNYFLLPVIWSFAFIAINLFMIILNYLDSKPLLSRTVMDFANKVCLLNLCFCTTMVATSSSMVVFFKDCGEITALVIAYCGFLQYQHFSLLLLVIITTQILLVKNPSFLESVRFEKIIKITVCSVPACTAGAGGTALFYLGMKPRGYYFLRGKRRSDEDLVLLMFLAGTHLLLCGAFWLSRAWIRKTQPQLTSNHILSSKSVGLLCMDGLLFFILSLTLPDPYQKYLYQIGPNFIMLKFSGSIVFFHQSVFDHACHLHPLRTLWVAWAVQQHRRVGAF